MPKKVRRSRSKSVARRGRRSRSKSVVRRRRKTRRNRSRSRRHSSYSSWDREKQLEETEVRKIGKAKEKNLLLIHNLNPTSQRSYTDETKSPVCSMLEHEWNHVKGHKCALDKKGETKEEKVSKRKSQLMRGILKGIHQYHSGLKCKNVTGNELKYRCSK